MKKQKQLDSHLFSVLKATEGGIGQKQAMEDLKAAGIKCRRAYSPYVGHAGIEVLGSKRDSNRANRILFGKD